jgi:predicted transcriptional regulator
VEEKASMMEYDIKKAGSDRAELTRDMATYEVESSNATNLELRIQELQYLNKDMEKLVGRFATFEDEGADFSKSIEDQYKEAFQITAETPDLINATRLEMERYDLNDINSWMRTVHAFQGMVTISGITCLIKVSALRI